MRLRDGWIVMLLVAGFATNILAQDKTILYRASGRTRTVLESNLQSGATLPVDYLKVYSPCNVADTLINIGTIAAKPFTDDATGVALTTGYDGAANESLVFVHNDSLSRAYDADIIPSNLGFTWTAWVKHGDVASTKDFLFSTMDGDTTGVMVWLDPADSLLYFMMSDTSAADSTGGGFSYAGADTLSHTSKTLVDDAWHFIAIRHDTTGATDYMRITIDGVTISAAVDSANGSMTGNGDQRFIVGNGSFKFSTSTQGWDGELDEVQIWNTVLSDGQLEYIRSKAIMK
jgi:hypothetical protein